MSYTIQNDGILRITDFLGPLRFRGLILLLVLEELRLLLKSSCAAPALERRLARVSSEMVNEVTLLRELLHACRTVEVGVQSLCDIVDGLDFEILPAVNLKLLWLGFGDKKFLPHVVQLSLELGGVFLV